MINKSQNESQTFGSKIAQFARQYNGGCIDSENVDIYKCAGNNNNQLLHKIPEKFIVNQKAIYNFSWITNKSLAELR